MEINMDIKIDTNIKSQPTTPLAQSNTTIHTNQHPIHYKIIGKGWDNSSDEQESSPRKTIVVNVSSNQPSFLATSTCLVQSALTILKDFNKMPEG